MVVCPYCRNETTPTRNALGQLVCPLCSNTGMVQTGAPPAAAWGTPPPTASDVDRRGRNARTFGILGVTLWLVPYLGFLASLGFSITAIVVGSGVKRDLRPATGHPAYAMAKTAVVLGIIGLCVLPVVIILAAIVFVLVTKLSGVH